MDNAFEHKETLDEAAEYFQAEGLADLVTCSQAAEAWPRSRRSQIRAGENLNNDVWPGDLNEFGRGVQDLRLGFLCIDLAETPPFCMAAMRAVPILEISSQ